MARLTSSGYVAVRTGGRKRGRVVKGDIHTYRDWWLVRSGKSSGYISLRQNISFPQNFIGKKVQLKVIVIDNII